MSDLTVKQVNETVLEAEEKILGILLELQRVTGLTVSDVQPKHNWYTSRNEEGVFEADGPEHWSELVGILIEMNWR